jgi:hypothetical protein
MLVRLLERTVLFGEEARLVSGGRSGRRFAARNSNDAEHGNFGESAARHKDAISCGVQVGRRDLQAVVEQREQVIGYNAFECGSIGEAQAYPQAIELRAAQKSFAFRLKVVRKLSYKIDRTDFSQRNLLVLTIRSEDVNRVSLPQSSWTEIAANGLLVQEFDNDFLVRRGWGSGLQRIRT